MDMQEADIKDAEQQGLILQLKEEECLRTNDTRPDGWCPRVWDGIMCWPSAAPSTISILPCPAYLIGFHIEENATKACTATGKWYISTQHDTEWTNYSLCAPAPDIDTDMSGIPDSDFSILKEYVPMIKTMSVVGYGISLAALFVAFALLTSFKRLRCPRNTLHAHLFLSFMLRAALSLLKHWLFFQGLDIPSDARDSDMYLRHLQVGWICKAVTCLWQYFILANYSWLLMEGLYLHNLIFLALFSDTSAITSYIVLGWSAPLVFVIPWAVLRATVEDVLCWTTNPTFNYFLILLAPISASIVVS